MVGTKKSTFHSIFSLIDHQSILFNEIYIEGINAIGNLRDARVYLKRYFQQTKLQVILEHLLTD